MLKGGVISESNRAGWMYPPRKSRPLFSSGLTGRHHPCAVDVVNAEEARIAEEAGACAVMVRSAVLSRFAHGVGPSRNV